MRTKSGIIGENEIKGWTICSHGQRIHLRGISKAGAFEQAKLYSGVEWVRPFAIRFGWRVIGC
jgi:hypothetical protein